MKQLEHGRWAGAVLVLFAVAACDRNATDPRVEFDPEPTTAFVAETLTPLSQNVNLLRGLRALEYALLTAMEGSAAAFSTAVPRGERVDVGAGRPVARPLARHAWAPLLSFPAPVEGETLVFVPEENRYAVDAEAVGAPPEGVRVTHYTMTTASRPRVPLEVRGYFDLTDESTSSVGVLRVHGVSTAGATETTLIDYAVAVEGGGTVGQGAMELSSVGSIAGGGRTLDFELSQAFEWSESADHDELLLVYRFQAPGEQPVELTMTSVVPFEHDYDPVDVEISTPDGVNIIYTLDGTAVTGEITVQGTTVLTLSGTDPNPVFEWADGRAMTTEERTALRDMFTGMHELLYQPSALFAPLGVLLLME